MVLRYGRVKIPKAALAEVSGLLSYMKNVNPAPTDDRILVMIPKLKTE